MKKYFLNKKRLPVDIDASVISAYREQVITEMKMMNASTQEIALLKNETILNSLRSNRQPKDVAWAILQ